MGLRSIFAAVAAILIGTNVIAEPTTQPTSADTPLKYTMKDIDGKDVNLADYKGRVVMIVNVASKCGFTKQYEQLESVYEQYKAKGFVILGFPANDFKSQEPGSDADIKTFCTTTYGVTFPMFSKVSVKGEEAAPLYKFLVSKEMNGQFGGAIGWNFTKFLIDKNGHVYARFASKTTPDDPTVIAAIEKGLGNQ